jgi:hypothetical protein
VRDADADAPVDAADPGDRDRILELLEDGIQEAHRKVEQGRVYDADNEKVRIKWIRALAYATNVYRQTLKDRELEQMRDRLEELEDRIDG